MPRAPRKARRRASRASRARHPMSNVFFFVTMSLDGYIAPGGMDLTHAHDPSYNDWLNQRMELQQWVFPQPSFRGNLKLGEGGEPAEDTRIREETPQRPGVRIGGNRIFVGSSPPGCGCPRRSHHLRQA